MCKLFSVIAHANVLSFYTYGIFGRALSSQNKDEECVIKLDKGTLDLLVARSEDAS
jgi:hypothetical protein